MTGELLGRGAVQTEFRTAKDSVRSDRRRGRAGGHEGRRAARPRAGEHHDSGKGHQVSLLGEVLEATTAAGREVATPGRPVAIVSNVQVTYVLRRRPEKR